MLTEPASGAARLARALDALRWERARPEAPTGRDGYAVNMAIAQKLASERAAERELEQEARSARDPQHAAWARAQATLARDYVRELLTLAAGAKAVHVPLARAPRARSRARRAARRGVTRAGPDDSEHEPAGDLALEVRRQTCGGCGMNSPDVRRFYAALGEPLAALFPDPAPAQGAIDAGDPAALSPEERT